jgi:hypothetical protein
LRTLYTKKKPEMAREMMHVTIAKVMLENVLKELGRFGAKDGELAMDVSTLYGIALKYRRVHDALDDDDACANAEAAVQCFRDVCTPPPPPCYEPPIVFFERRVLSLLTTQQGAVERFLALISMHVDTKADLNLACRTLQRVADTVGEIASDIAADDSTANDISRSLAEFKRRVAACMASFIAA